MTFGGILGLGFILAICVLLIVAYLIPWFVARARGTTNQGIVLLVNVLLGWCFVGWVVALLMACLSKTKRELELDNSRHYEILSVIDRREPTFTRRDV